MSHSQPTEAEGQAGRHELLVSAISPEDEFLIQADGPGMENRSWTRSTLGVAQYIADQAVTKLGYAHAEVRNQYGGHLSDTLYEVRKVGSSMHKHSFIGSPIHNETETT